MINRVDSFVSSNETLLSTFLKIVKIKDLSVLIIDYFQFPADGSPRKSVARAH